jgi:hypothetical protein
MIFSFLSKIIPKLRLAFARLVLVVMAEIESATFGV